MRASANFSLSVSPTISQVDFPLLYFYRYTKSEYVKYKDRKQPVSVTIQDLMKRMMPAEKIGQMTQIELTVASVMKNYLIGKSISFS